MNVHSLQSENLGPRKGRLKKPDGKRRDGQKCKVGKRENGKRGTKTAWVENSGKGVYNNGQPNFTLCVVLQLQPI